jgi:hypothetical protein
MRENPEFNEKVIVLLANRLGMPREEAIARALKPWGLLQAMKGKWPDYGLEKQQTAIEDRLLTALEIVNFADKVGDNDPQLVRETLRQLMVSRGEEAIT